MKATYTIDTYTATWDDAMACKGGGLAAGETVRMPSDDSHDGREIDAFHRRLREAGLDTEYEYSEGGYDYYDLIDVASDDDDTDAETYTYSIYDCDPASGGDAWPSQTDVEFDAEDAADAKRLVRELLAQEGAWLRTADGYAPGDRIFAAITCPDCTGDTVSYELTSEDLGVAS